MKPYEDLEVTSAECAVGLQLAREGWRSTSNKYRHVARLRSGLRAADLIRPEVLTTPAGTRLADLWKHEERFLLRTSDSSLVEEKHLTVGEFAAFKLAGGETA